jgi:hypothetical protein
LFYYDFVAGVGAAFIFLLFIPMHMPFSMLMFVFFPFMVMVAVVMSQFVGFLFATCHRNRQCAGKCNHQ